MYKIKKSFPRCFALGLVGLAVTGAQTFADTGREKVNYFDLPGQSLQTGLIEFALQANVTVITDNNLIKNYRSGFVVGPNTVDNALSGLLSGTPFEYRYQPETGAYVIQPKKTEIVTEFPAVEQPETIEELVVVGASYPFRYHTVSNSHLHGNMSYFDSSRFINVIPETLIRDQESTDLGDVLKYASSITPGDGITDSNDDIYIRGFRRHAIYVDGFRLSDTTGVKMLPANVERVEILKGPSTLLYGQAEPGGMVNVVRKKPEGLSFFHSRFGAGSDGQRFVNLDLNGQAPVDTDINYRVILADEARDEAAEISDIHRQLIATSASWQWSPNTIVDLGYEYQKAEQVWDRNFAVFRPVEGVFDGAMLDDIAKQARDGFDTEFKLFSAELNHYIGADWRLQAKYFWHDEHRTGVRTTGDTLLKTDVFYKNNNWGNDYLLLIPGGQIALPILLDPRPSGVFYSIGNIRGIYDEEAFETQNNAAINLEGSFSTGDLIHHITMGADWHRQDLYKAYTVEVRNPFPLQTWSEADFGLALLDITETIFDPDRPLGDLELVDYHLLYDDYGIYVQDNIELNEQWVLSAGGRYTKTEGEFTDFADGVFTPLRTYNDFSSQLGLVYKPGDSHSIYASYSEALRANYHIDDIGPRAAEPELSNQIELGVKTLLLDGKLLANFAVFAINKKNIVDINVIEGIRTSMRGHEQQNAGFDLDFTWQVRPGFDVIGAFSMIDPEIVSGENEGNQPALAAEQTASFFARYQFKNGFEINGGYKYVSNRLADDENDYWLGEYALVDLGLSYRFDVIASQPVLALAVKNALDEQYYTAILDGVRMNESPGRSFVATLRIEL